jgi:hypothetical protein
MFHAGYSFAVLWFKELLIEYTDLKGDGDRALFGVAPIPAVKSCKWYFKASISVGNIKNLQALANSILSRLHINL